MTRRLIKHWWPRIDNQMWMTISWWEPTTRRLLAVMTEGERNLVNVLTWYHWEAAPATSNVPMMVTATTTKSAALMAVALSAASPSLPLVSFLRSC